MQSISAIIIVLLSLMQAKIPNIAIIIVLLSFLVMVLVLSILRF
jgi:hypothetical protein